MWTAVKACRPQSRSALIARFCIACEPFAVYVAGGFWLLSAAGQTALLPLAEAPCPSCTALLDQLDGAAGHTAQHVNLAVAAKAPLDHFLAFAAERGWRRLSSAGTTHNRDYVAEAADGAQQPMLNVFHREGRALRHFWGSELFYAPADPGQEPPQRRHHRAAVEPVRPHPRGTPGRLA